ncbi:MAG TPA: ABC transporter permease [Gemmatimonadales bacterium]|nr:ABC transporter permease [Gemmatimonadales bacterium]
MLESLLQDLRYAARSLARTPVLAVAAVLTLGLGIGANSAMFGVVDRLFFRPPAQVKDPGRVRAVDFTVTSRTFGTYTEPLGTYPRLVDFQRRAHAFTGVAAYAGHEFSLGTGERSQKVDAILVSAQFFTVAGLRPALGRFFSDSEAGAAQAAHVAVISSEFWHRQFGGAPSVLGTTLQLGRSSYTVIGVTPPGFGGFEMHVPDVWMPMGAAAPEALWGHVLTCDGCFWFGGVVGRLAPNVTIAQAAAEATALYRNYVPAQGKPQDSDSTATARLSSLNQAMVGEGPTGPLSIWLAVVCGIVLLIACANVANLLLARAVQRRREIALRVALGSSRGRLVRQLFVESALLAVLGGAAAVLVAMWAGPVLRAAIISEANAADAVDTRMLIFTAAGALATAVLAGVAPALHAIAPDISGALKSGAREGHFQRSFTRTGLLVGQVALTLVLLTGAGLFVATLRHVQGLRLGFDADRLIVASVDLDGMGLKKPAIMDMYRRIQNRVAQVPGVTSASLSIGTPFRASWAVGLKVPGRDSLPSVKTGGPYIDAVTPEYFRTMGTAIRQGRSFTDADTWGAEHVAIVNETFAKMIWPTESALGKCLLIGGDEEKKQTPTCTTVVGVAEDSRRSDVREETNLQYYVPLAQSDSLFSDGPSSLLVRTAGASRDYEGNVRRAVQATDPSLPFPSVSPMPQLFANRLRPWRLGSSLFSLFGGLGLLLSAIGLYGVLSYMVSQRTSEMGIRVALGAARRDILTLVVRQGLRVTAIGLVIGVAGSLVAGTALGSLLYGVSPHDPVVLGTVVMVLAVVATLASYLPALRATRVDPMVALRYE